MEIDFNNVKKITTPDGPLVEIRDEYGNIMGQAQAMDIIFAESVGLSGNTNTSAANLYGTTTSNIGYGDGQNPLYIDFAKGSGTRPVMSAKSYYTQYYNGTLPSVLNSATSYWSSTSTTTFSSPRIIYGTQLNPNYSKQYLLAVGSNRTNISRGKYCALTAEWVPLQSLWGLNLEYGYLGQSFTAGSVKFILDKVYTESSITSI